MVLLITGGEVYAPEPLGRCDVLVCGERIVRVAPDLGAAARALEAEVLDASGKLVLPGFLDQHVHILGGNDFHGPNHRTFGMRFRNPVENGVTTLVTLLGSEHDDRTLHGMIRRAQDFDLLGLTTYAYTGSFELGAPTLTGSVYGDIVMVEKILGLKIAIAEPTGSHPTYHELARTCGQAYLAGQNTGKAGVIHVHIGRGPDQLDSLFDLIERSGLPIDTFVVTHVNQSAPNTLEPAIRFARQGGTIDVTGIQTSRRQAPGNYDPPDAVLMIFEAGIPLERVTLSSDGNLSSARRDAQRRPIAWYTAGCEFLYREWLAVKERCNLALPEALKLITTNIARVLKLEHKKGRIAPGLDADLLIADAALEIQTTIARGNILMRDRQLLVEPPFPG